MWWPERYICRVSSGESDHKKENQLVRHPQWLKSYFLAIFDMARRFPIVHIFFFLLWLHSNSKCYMESYCGVFRSVTLSVRSFCHLCNVYRFFWLQLVPCQESVTINVDTWIWWSGFILHLCNRVATLHESHINHFYYETRTRSSTSVCLLCSQFPRWLNLTSCLPPWSLHVSGLTDWRRMLTANSPLTVEIYSRKQSFADW
jgi:hypothetical protein